MFIIKKKSIITLLVTTLILYSCKKYEENPTLVLSSKKSRLVGEWELIKIDGEPIENYFNNLYANTYYGSSLNIDYFKMTWDFEKDQDLDQDLKMIFSYSDTNYNGNTYSFTDSTSLSTSMTWEWEDKKSVIEIEQSSSYSTVRDDYEILKLTSSELKLRDEDDLEWEFEKK